MRWRNSTAGQENDMVNSLCFSRFGSVINVPIFFSRPKYKPIYEIRNKQKWNRNKIVRKTFHLWLCQSYEVKMRHYTSLRTFTMVLFKMPFLGISNQLQRGDNISWIIAPNCRSLAALWAIRITITTTTKKTVYFNNRTRALVYLAV